MQWFEFIFSLRLMRTILGITNELLKALKRKYQDIVNAMNLVQICKEQLQMMRDGGWNSFFDQVSSFCVEHDIVVPNMDEVYYSRSTPA